MQIHKKNVSELDHNNQKNESIEKYSDSIDKPRQSLASIEKNEKLENIIRIRSINKNEDNR